MKKIIFFHLILFCQISRAQLGLTGYDMPPGLKGASTVTGNNMMDCDPQGNVWVAIQNAGTLSLYAGIGKFDGSSWTIYDSLNTPMQSNRITCISHDHQNYLWIGTDKGLAKFDGTAWTWYDTTNSILGTNYIFNLYAYNGKAFIVTGGAPVYRQHYIVTAATGVFELLDISSLVGSAAVNGYNVPCISPQGNFYLKRMNGDPSIIRIDGAGNQSITTFYFFPSPKFFEVDENEKIWLNVNWYYDSGVKFFTSCPPVPEVFLQSSDYSTASSNWIERSYQNIFYFQRGNLFLSSSNDPSRNYYIPADSIEGIPVYFSIAPSGDIWFLNDYPYQDTTQRRLYRLTHSQYNPSVLSQGRRDNFLDINEVMTRITPICDMHWDPVNSQGPQYVVPKCSGVNSSFASAMWIGGLDANDTLHLAAQTYRQDGSDFWPGPLDTLSASIDSATSAAYNRVWRVNREDIVNFVYQYQLGNVSNMSYPVPYDILTWPAQGTGNYSRDLAPFVDYNNDGVYNPYDGDYPKIKGDQMCYSIFNDVLHPHTETGGKSLGFEFHKSSYAAACPQVADSNRVINYTTYYEYEIFNRSSTNYHDMYIGLYADMDLGNFMDDYVGCDTMLHAGFTYNGDNDDENNNVFSSYSPSYGLNPPIQNVMILDGPHANLNDGHDNDNDGTVDEAGEKVLMTNFTHYWKDFTNQGYPSLPMHFYYRMASRWKNGQQVTFGGNGAGGGFGATNIPCNYMFPGTPHDTTQWIEAVTGNIPADRTFLMGSGPFSLPAHSKTKISFAYVWTRDESNPNGINTSIARNRTDLLKIRQWFDADTIPSCLQLYPDSVETPLKPLFNLFPNPADESITIQYAVGTLNPQYKIYDVRGRLVKTGKLHQNISVINISMLRNSSYIFEITDGDIRTTRSFVKQ